MTLFRLTNTMAVDIRYLWERSPSGPYWFKRKVPKALVPLVGKSWVQFSLKTRDLKAAARLISKHVTEQDRHWAELTTPTREGSIEQGRRLLQAYGVDPVDPRADEMALDLFFDAVEEQLPRKVRDEHQEAYQLDIPIAPKDIDQHLPPAFAAAFAMAQGRFEHLASDCMREYVAARTDDAQSVKSASLPFEYLIKLAGDKPLAGYRRADVRRYVEHLLAGKHSPTGKGIATSTVERYITSLRAAFARSIKEHELRIENVWAGTIEFPKGAKGAGKLMTFAVSWSCWLRLGLA
ncbi:DUF6538 domain-containing protein [Paraburkholderia phymatum]|uniref:DUF6538 domain-containing protein n=1 Tax=Paraburkholderia phymatum TaxID=148447 RepID=UPI0000E78506|nr:DUF6538 domain-containing protein [Paraburkholderia phymatum]